MLERFIPPKRVSDTDRIQNLLSNIIYDNKPCTLQADAKKLLLDYTDEITCAIIEEAALLSLHRKSKVIDELDINLIFGRMISQNANYFFLT